jgi:hypothetical protein
MHSTHLVPAVFITKYFSPIRIDICNDKTGLSSYTEVNKTSERRTRAQHRSTAPGISELVHGVKFLVTVSWAMDKRERSFRLHAHIGIIIVEGTL